MSDYIERSNGVTGASFLAIYNGIKQYADENGSKLSDDDIVRRSQIALTLAYEMKNWGQVLNLYFFDII